MPRSLEDRRRAIVNALRALSDERRRPDADPPVATERLDVLAGAIEELRCRLSSVESTLATAEQLRPIDPYQEPDEPDEPVAVPPVVLDDVRMSSGAARALFGG